MDGGLPQLKGALRRQARARRAALAPEWRAAASAAIGQGILNLPEARAVDAPNIAVFASFGDEINTYPLLERLIAIKGGVLLPRVVPGERRLEFRRVTGLAVGLVPAYQGIPEPDPQVYPEVIGPGAMDLIVVPGLLYDRRGFRLGYGGGFYDRLLSEPHRGRAVGIVFSPLLQEEPLPVGPSDRPVDAILTEAGLLMPSP